ncbi:hypothetical protein DMB66_01835 [Actinoplanes sp. ATCC 53533]|uniref:hypothetical protein n=1 Tax=Actinoplanes sp. ATCC 53533 TaxID=1288362 RepID=UPI000F79B6D6|nr:hypothetical protein [Actinoplanes sp. ATCC 53533]RSM74180.1 hypothetical protein DMB66_01835 [Actinoplanes sp. ATCC 53533]
MSHPQPPLPRRPPPEPFPEDPTKATRHLCAGAYLDETFRNESLRQVYYQPRRLVAPSYGFDLVPVLAHCLRARNGAVVRDLAIVGTFLVAACISWLAVLLVLSSMVSLQAAIATYRLARDTIRRLRTGAPVRLGTLVPRMFLLVLGWTVATVFGSFVSGTILRQGSRTLLEGGTDGVESAVSGLAAGALVLALLIFLYPTAFSLWRQSALTRLTPGSRVTLPLRDTRLDEVARQQRGNTVVYSGYRPYVGSGLLVETWGFAQRLVQPEQPFVREFEALRGDRRGSAAPDTERDREFATPPFTAQEVVDYVRNHLATLLPEREAEAQITGLTVEDRILLAGTEVSHLGPHTTPEVMAAVIRHPSTPARHYLTCQVFSWGGQLITTVYVHLAVQGRSLYLELTTTALPPCAEAYRVVDTEDGTGALAWLRALRAGVADTPQAIWRAPAGLAGALITMVAAGGAPAGGDNLTPGYDYGARIGVRELGSDLEMRNLTQLQDVGKYQKLIERRVIASVLDFLDDRGVDTIEYRARAASVLNANGVNNFGDNVSYQGPVAGRDMGVRGERA